MDIPGGNEHLEGVNRGAFSVFEQSMQDCQTLLASRRLLGTSLSALYQAATCSRKCDGGPHILESLCGRLYNLGISSYLLAMCGLYDEALNLTRSIGEAANLISLSVVDKQALSEWLASDTKTRITKFSPAKVRKALNQHDSALLIASGDWYAEFCEKYTHVTPQTKPNLHEASGQAFVGGLHRPEDLQKTIDEISTTIGLVALLVCRYFDLDDLYAEILEIAKQDEDG